MFEEDFERCFICQQACKGLYCSSECRNQDKGTPSPALRATRNPVRLTVQMPVALGPRRPTVPIGPSPKMPDHVRGDSSTSSSITSSPIQSPRTNPSGSNSPRKETFNLPPPAYSPQQTLAFPGSVPMKIPPLVPRPSAVLQQGKTPGSTGSKLYPIGASIDTLRFGRKPGITNSVTSPNALLPRCACGKPVNHKGRALLDLGFQPLNLGPAMTAQPAGLASRSVRVVSDSAITQSQERFHSITVQHGYNQNAHDQIHTVSNVMGDVMGDSLRYRSRSNPFSSSPKGRPSAIAPMTTREDSNIAPNRRASIANGSTQHVSSIAPIGGGVRVSVTSPGLAPPSIPAVSSVGSPRRGRSRERHDHAHAPLLDNGNNLILNQSAEREQAPSRSRHRREERRPSDERRKAERERAREVVTTNTAGIESVIAPSWSRHPSLTEAPLHLGATFAKRFLSASSLMSEGPRGERCGS